MSASPTSPAPSQGANASFTVDAFPKATFQGRVAQVRQAPVSVQNVITYDVVITVDNPDLLLKPGMTATARIVTAQALNVLRVPSQALRFTPAAGRQACGPPEPRQAGQRVGLGGAGRQAGPVPVTVGLDDDTYAEIKAGDLKLGDQVVTSEAAAGSAPQGVTRPRRCDCRGRRAWPSPSSASSTLTRSFQLGDTEVHALQGVSVSVERGEFVAIMGSSGSGKSTMMNIIGCLDRPTSGQYVFEGRDVARLSEPELADIRSQRIGFVFQSFNLLARTSALENVVLPLLYGAAAALSSSERNDRGRDMLASVGLADRARNMPNQLSGRPAAARRAGPGAHQPSRRAAGRRADRQPRYAHLPRDHGDHSQAQSRAGRHGDRGDPRSGYRRLRRPSDRDARRTRSCPMSIRSPS